MGRLRRPPPLPATATVWLTVLLGFLAAPAAPRSVEFSLTADWPTWGLSSLQEAGEYLATEVEGDEGLFWTFVEELEVSSGSRAQLDQAAQAPRFQPEALDTVWALTLNQTAPLLHPLSHSMLHLYLSLRAYSPTLELHRSLRKGPAFAAAVAAPERSGCQAASTSWALVSAGPGAPEQVVCQADALAAVLAATRPGHDDDDATDEDSRVLDFDHVFPSPASSSPVVVTLYSPLGTSEFYAFHHVLAPKAAAGELQYVLRHFVPAATDARAVPTALQGYGIYLDIKNMEYKNIDDSPGPGSQEGAAAAAPLAEVAIAPDEDVSGLHFATLLEREPGLSTELRQLRANLQKEEAEGAGAGADTNMKVWRMRDLGLQAFQTIATAKDPLRKLQDLAQNFPSHATRLSSLKVTDAFRDGAIAGLQAQVLGYGTALKPGTMFVNGLPKAMDAPTFNVFDVLKAIRDEVRLLQSLDRLPATPAVRSQLVQVAATAPAKPGRGGRGGTAAAETRLDIYRGSKGAIFHLNNIEKDVPYQRWPRTLQQLMYPSWQLHAVARNLYTMTLVVDVTDPASLRAVATMRDLFERTFPVRFSILLVSRSALDRAHMDSALLADAAGSKALFLDAVQGAKEQDPVTTEAVGMLFHHLREEHGLEAALAFLFGIGQPKPKGGGAPGVPPTSVGTYAQAVEAYSEAVAKAKGSWKGSAHIAEGWEALRAGKGEESVRLMHKLVVDKGLPVGCFLLNGLLQPSLDIEGSIMQLLGAEQQQLGQMVATGRLHDNTKSILGVVLKGPHVFTRYHPAIDEDARRTAKAVMLLGPQAKALTGRLAYLHPSGTAAAVKPLSAILLADLGTQKGLASTQAVLAFLRRETPADNEVATGGDKKEDTNTASTHVRCAILHKPTVAAATTKKGAALGQLLRVSSDDAARLGALEKLAKFLAQTPGDVDLAAAGVLASFVATLTDDAEAKAAHAFQGELGAATDKDATELTALACKVLGVGADSDEVLVVNGRQMPLGGKPLHPLDLDVVFTVEAKTFTQPLLDVFAKEAKGATAAATSDQMLVAHSFLNLYASSPRVDVQGHLNQLKGTPGEKLVLELQPPGSSKGGFETDPVLGNLAITVLLDPLGETAQRVAPLLTILRDHLQVPLRVVMAPNPELTEFPLKSYYRFAIFPTRETRVLFQSLPTQHILTTRVDTPEAWNVQTRKASQDLDNLKCSESGTCGDREGSTHTAAELVLKNLLVYGQCFDARLREPVNGLQLVLVDGVADDQSCSSSSDSTALMPPRHHHHSDTLVMQNYGYFQLRADPGLWKVQLAAGRARELYELVRETGGGQLELLPGQALVVAKRDFTHALEHLRVRKQAGKEQIPLLDEISQDEAEGGGEVGEGVWSSLSNKLFGGAGKGAGDGEADDDETVHVFSLATGHLYERLLKIMMLSVSKRTSVRVKFWLLENFLSPAFKTAAQAMAQHNGFQVEFITYKWPDWLRQQTEKQRIIWGYKILFLDVLFPLSVKKIIYVDADQVLRADLKELWDLDLKGRPYGYTPFCTSREETLGFQFWRSGYWANHLQGRPYHISALYVVDLQRFRRMAVGDKLRAIYDQLSRDPNSLANLDQDLPNYAQHMVPIFSLPQEWLWCETWCNEESKGTAKTIDLCNSPLHKESKLDMAKRVISGSLFNESWIELDEEVKRVEKTLKVNLPL